MPVYKLDFDMVKKNIENVQNRRYIASGTVLSLTNFFHVPKGGSDIRLVYDLELPCHILCKGFENGTMPF